MHAHHGGAGAGGMMGGMPLVRGASGGGNFPSSSAAAAAGAAAALPGHDMASMLPEALQLLPLFCMALAKSALHRGGEHVRSDERAALVYRMLTMPVREARAFIYPRLFSLHDMESEAGRPEPGAAPFADPVTGELVARVALPPTGARGADGGFADYPLSAASLTPQGCFLLEDGVELFLWVGREAPAGLVNALFGVGSLAGLDCAHLQLVDRGNDYSARVCAVVRTLRAGARTAPRLRVVAEGAGDVNEARFHWHLVEDRQAFKGGEQTYAEYSSSVWRESQMSGAALGGGGGGGGGAQQPQIFGGGGGGGGGGGLLGR
jgi:protein transport protein SEC24